jgi:hypothetical protein
MRKSGGARLQRHRSDVRIVSGAPEKREPRVPGLWREGFRPPRSRKRSMNLQAREMPRGHSCVLSFEAAFGPGPVGFSMRPHSPMKTRLGIRRWRLSGGHGVSRPMLQRFHKMHRSGGLAHRPLYCSRQGAPGANIGPHNRTGCRQ